MKAKHKLLSDFQYISPDKKIFVLKSGTILEEYNYKVKSEVIPIDRDIVDNNPEFFEVVDWKAELLSFMRVNKMPQPAQLGKKLIPFIEEMVLSSVPTTQGQSSPDLERRENEVIRKQGEIERSRITLEQKEDELATRAKMIERKENSLKEDQSTFETRENAIRDKQKDLLEKELLLDEREHALRERERNVDGKALKSMNDIDSKYSDLQSKIERDMSEVTRKEKELDERSAEVARQEAELENRKHTDILEPLVESTGELALFKNMNTKLDGLIDKILQQRDQIA